MRCLALLATVFAATLHTSLGTDSVTRLSDACARTTVDVQARGSEDKIEMVCCSAEGCHNESAANPSTLLLGCLLCGTYDPFRGIVSWIEYSFGEPQDLGGILIKFDEAPEEMSIYVYLDGKYDSVIRTVRGTLVYHMFGPNTDDVSQVRLDPGYEESYKYTDLWLGIKRVEFKVY